MEFPDSILFSGFFLAVIAALTFFFGTIINSTGMTQKQNSYKYILGAFYLSIFVVLPLSIVYSIFFEFETINTTIISAESTGFIVGSGAYWILFFFLVGLYVMDNFQSLSSRGKKSCSKITSFVNGIINRTKLLKLPPLTQKENITGVVFWVNLAILLALTSVLYYQTLPIGASAFLILFTVAMLVSGADVCGKNRVLY